MTRDLKLYVEDILESIALIEEYAKVKDQMHYDAILRRFEIIGEASKHIPDEIKKQFKEIPWSKVIGLRNIVSHEYFGLSDERIYNLIEKNLLELKKIILKIKQKFC
jgi:uncharacterized protein with HEPN domain